MPLCLVLAVRWVYIAASSFVSPVEKEVPMHISCEQMASAHGALMAAGVLHGDETVVEVAVGVMAQTDRVRENAKPDVPHLAFCSAAFRVLGVTRKGSKWENEAPIEGSLTFANAHEVAPLLRNQRGIFRARATVFCNGSVSIHIDPKTVNVIPVDQDRMHLLCCAEGKKMTAKAL